MYLTNTNVPSIMEKKNKYQNHAFPLFLVHQFWFSAKYQNCILEKKARFLPVWRRLETTEGVEMKNEYTGNGTSQAYAYT